MYVYMIRRLNQQPCKQSSNVSGDFDDYEWLQQLQIYIFVQVGNYLNIGNIIIQN